MKFCFKVENKNELWQVQWQPGSYPTKPVYKKKDVPVVKEEGLLNKLTIINKFKLYVYKLNFYQHSKSLCAAAFERR